MIAEPGAPFKGAYEGYPDVEYEYTGFEYECKGSTVSSSTSQISTGLQQSKGLVTLGIPDSMRGSRSCPLPTGLQLPEGLSNFHLCDGPPLFEFFDTSVNFTTASYQQLPKAIYLNLKQESKSVYCDILMEAETVNNTLSRPK